jgi:hypothetical protein
MPSSIPKDNFAEFQQLLMGTWTNQAFPGSTQGGPKNLNKSAFPRYDRSNPTGS